MYKISLFFILFLSFLKNYAQQLSVPYDVLAGVPMVKISVDGKNHRFLFDTGAFKTVIHSDVFTNLPISSTVENVGGVGSERKQMDVVKFSFEFLGKYFKNKEVLYMNTTFNLINQHSCDELELVGVIGRDIMEDYIIEINPTNKKIVFHNPVQFNENQLPGFTKIELRNSSEPKVPITIENHKRYVLFDTGRTRGMSISNFKLDKYINIAKHTTYMSKSRGIGVHGFNEDIDIHHKIYNSNIKMNKLLVKNQVIETSGNDLNNMGFSFISQFISYLDLKGKRLYVKQISENSYGNSILEYLGFSASYNYEKKKNIVTLLAKNNDKLKLEDAILEVNGEIPPANNCETESFFEKFKGGPLKMTIERESKIIQVEQPFYSGQL